MTKGLPPVSLPLFMPDPMADPMADPMHESKFQCMEMARRCCLSVIHDRVGFQEGWVQGLPWPLEGYMNLSKSLDLSEFICFLQVYDTH